MKRLLCALAVGACGCPSDAEAEFPDMVALPGVVNDPRLECSLVGEHPRLLMNAEDFEPN